MGRPLALRMLGTFGAVTGYRPRQERGGLTVFVFHDVTEDPSPFERRHGLALSPQAFVRSIEWIARHYEVIGPGDLQDPGARFRRAALVTCDDGFAGALTEAAAILDDRHLPAMFFLNMGVAGGEPNVAAEAEFLASRPGSADAWPTGFDLPTGVVPDRLRAARDAARGGPMDNGLAEYQGRYATVEEVRLWDGHPRFGYGNHLWNHWSTSALDPKVLEEQYRKNEVALRELRSYVPWFAATSGLVTARQVDQLSRFGSERVLSGRGGPNRDPRSYVLRRVDLAGVGGSVSARGATILASATGRRSEVLG